MPITELDKHEERITRNYRAFLRKVGEAFDHHCESIRNRTMQEFGKVSEEDQETRQKIVDAEKAELDKVLIELKELLNRKKSEFRHQLEEIARKKDQQSFDFDKELEEVATENGRR